MNEQQITAPEKTVKVKDPKRVAAGRKLAEISKAAKEKKAREKFMAEEHEAACEKVYKCYVPLGIAVAVGLGLGYCYYYKGKKKEEVLEKKEEPPKPKSRLVSLD